jgi:uncharacterized protein
MLLVLRPYSLKECLAMPAGYPLLDPHAPHKAPRGACALAVMAKAPRLGAVKTRLVPPLYPEEAVALNVCFLRDVTANIAQFSDGGTTQGFAVYTPQGEESAFDGMLPKGFRLLSQRGTNLGERLFHAFEDFLLSGYETVCLINSDSPTLPHAVLREAVDTLREPGERIVLGEAADGGYYLIGLKRPYRQLFEDIAWSTEKVFSQTIERASEISLETRLLPVWYDVDDAASVRRLCGELFSGDRRSRDKRFHAYSAPHTRQYLRRLLNDGAGPRLGFRLSTAERAI